MPEDPLLKSPPPPKRPKYVGSFIRTEHNVTGDVFIVDNNTLLLQDFSYDGKVTESRLKV